MATGSRSDGPMRPTVHFTPPSGWLNDPNGLLSVDGAHHLFYQHHPDDTRLGPMHWGHAVSHDFVTWHHLPIALAPDDAGTIYSGSAATDVADTAGFGPGAFVAAFTYNADAGQSQALAWSTDGGTTFTKYSGNPVIPIADDRPLSRDPDVFRYSDGDREHWVMALAAGREIRIFTSPDLLTWTRTDAIGGFDLIDGTHVDGDVETPDLFPLATPDGSSVWVLTLGLSADAPAGGSGTAAVLGEFDGARFRPTDDVRWVDHGRHFYAAQSWNDVDDRRVWIGWMGNWDDERDALRGAPWRGQMSIPREVALLGRDGTYRLAQRPVRELRNRRAASQVDVGVVLTHDPHRPDVSGRALDVDLTGIAIGTAAFDVACRRDGVEVTVSVRDGRLIVMSEMSDAPAPVRFSAPLDDSGTGGVDLRILLDVESIEVWCGAASIGALLSNRCDEWTIEASTDGREIPVEQFAVHALGGPRSRAAGRHR